MHFVFQRLKGGKQPKPSVFTKIKTGGKSSSPGQDSSISHLGEVNEVKGSIPSCMKHSSALAMQTETSSSSSSMQDDSMLSLLGEVNEVQSSAPSHMKCISAFDIKADNFLKVKRCALVITSYEVSSNS